MHKSWWKETEKRAKTVPREMFFFESMLCLSCFMLFYFFMNNWAETLNYVQLFMWIFYEQNEQKDFLENYFFNYLHIGMDGLLLTQHCFSGIRNQRKVHKRIEDN